jgi:hypothetical protein
MAAVKVRALRAQCDALAADLLQAGQATADALRVVRPGGAENPKRDGSAWVRFYGQLQLLRGRAQSGASSGSGGSASDDSLTLAALSAAPTIVRTLAGERAVHPKSLSTLLHCHGRELVLGKLAALVAALKDADTNDEHADSIADAVDEIDRQLRILAWIALTTGPGLPFPRHDRAPAIPDDVAALDPVSVLEINRGFARVNWVNLRAMQSLIEPDPDAGGDRTRPSWSVFAGALAVELHEDPKDLIENRALVSIMAMTSLAASSRRAAMNDAKRQHERSRETTAA